MLCPKKTLNISHCLFWPTQKPLKQWGFVMGCLFSHHLYCVNFVDIPSHLFVLMATGSSEHIIMLTSKLAGWSVGQPQQFNLIHTPQSHWEASFSGCCWSWLYIHSAVPMLFHLDLSKIYLNILTERRNQWYWQGIFNQWGCMSATTSFPLLWKPQYSR